LKTEVLVWWCGWNDWLSGSCWGTTVRPVQAWKSDVKLTSRKVVYYASVFLFFVLEFLLSDSSMEVFFLFFY